MYWTPSKVWVCALMLLALFSSTTLKAQEEVSKTDSLEKKSYLLAFPVAFRFPETRWGAGVASLLNFYFDMEDSLSPPSQIQLGAAYTQNKQVLSSLPFHLFWGQRKNVAYGELSYYRYSYNYFGQGDFIQSQAQNYDANFTRIRLNYLREIKHRWYLGLRMWLEDFEIEANEPGLLGQNMILGEQGGRTWGFGLILNQDRRDQVFYPKKGHFIELVSHPDFKPLSEFNFWRNRADLRLYKHLAPKLVWANQVFIDYISGDAPFFAMAILGGQNRMRGMFEGRYRDNTAVLFQSEIRAEVYKRFGAVAFLSIGNTGENFKDLGINSSSIAGGAGLRFVLDREKHLNLRLDFAVSEDHQDYYFTIGEAF